MPRTDANGIQIEYETLGDPHQPTLLLVMGLGSQLMHWDDELCELFVERGYHVVRFDNRDAGLSTKIDTALPVDLEAAQRGESSSAPYLLRDMAADCVGLLDHLGVSAAHVLGVSLGGMIAQTMAIEFGDRVASLVSVMSTTGDRSVGAPSAEGKQVLVSKAPDDPDGYVEHSLRNARITGSPGFALDEDRLRRKAAAAYARCFYPEGVGRQLVAILASGDRTEQLRRLQVPTVVVHGDADALVGISGGKATADAVPEAEFVEVAGLGHDLPAEIWPILADGVERAAARARETSTPQH